MMHETSNLKFRKSIKNPFLVLLALVKKFTSENPNVRMATVSYETEPEATTGQVCLTGSSDDAGIWKKKLPTLSLLAPFSGNFVISSAIA